MLLARSKKSSRSPRNLGYVFQEAYLPIIFDIQLSQADFEMPDVGSTFANIISAGDGDSDMYFTITISENLPDLQEGTPEAIEKIKVMEGLTKEAVNMTIEHLRQAAITGGRIMKRQRPSTLAEHKKRWLAK